MRTKVGHFFYSRGNAKIDPEKDKSKVKPPKTYKEQVELYKSRNLYIEDSEYAEKTLQRINYYRLLAYGLTLKDPINKKQYSNTSSYNKMLSLYKFDRRLRFQLIFATIYIIQRLLTRAEGNRFITDLEALVLEYEDDIDFAHIGFPSNWRELLSKINSKKNNL